MQIKFRRLIINLFLWLTAEILLGFLGLDDLADYGEYLKEQEAIALLASL
ncbi:MAG: hypothetical protein AAFQ89_25235 [Cyanobacteria bacterium J06626_18]